ncbi:MAG: FAD binding domain-containing protein, partial [Spirochaetia bacterium]
EQAVDILGENGGRARIIAGGTDLMQALRDRMIDAQALVDITRIEALGRIDVDGDWIQIGAAVTFAMLRDSPIIREHARCLACAAATVGAAPIQAMATWAGNIVQAMPAADGGVAAVALDAQAYVVDAHGARWVAVEALYKGAKTSVLDPTQQVVSHLRFAVPRSGSGSAWRRIGRRPALTLPILNCAATLRLNPRGQTISEVSLALGPVAALPFRARDAERFLIGRALDDSAIGHAAELAQAECHLRSNLLRASKEYRAALVPILVRQALSEARDRAMNDHRAS